MRASRLRWIVLPLGLSLLIGTGEGCGPSQPEVRMPAEPTPKPTRTPPAKPRPRRGGRFPIAKPSPGGGTEDVEGTAPAQPARDITREPLTRAIGPRTTPDVADALRLGEEARQQLDKGTTDRAIELCEQAIKTSPRTVPPYVVVARALLAEGQLQQARTYLEKVLALSPPPPWLAEIIALNGVRNEAMGRKDAAIAEYRRAIGIYSGNQTAREALDRLTGSK